MATKSFTKDFIVSKKNAQTVARIVSSTNRETTLSMGKRVSPIKKGNLKNFFGLGN